MKYIVFLALLILTASVTHATDSTPVWSPFSYFAGTWQGTGEGKWGASEVEREYSFIMGGKFLLGKNRSDYQKQLKNPEGELHDNWDIFSYDKARKKYVLRQFHAETIVNQYTADSLDVSQGKFEFITESIENFSPGWQAKEVYEIVNANEFIETFYLAAPGKEFILYVTNRFKRIK